MEEFHSYYFDTLDGREPLTEDFLLPRGAEMTPELLSELVRDHEENHVPRYRVLKWAYEGRYKVFSMPKKDPWKPDNRLAANFAKYICDTFNGYFIGKPVRIDSRDERVAEYLRRHGKENGQGRLDARLSKNASKYGHCYEHFWRDGAGGPRSSCLTPLCSFMVYDDTSEHLPMFGVFHALDEEGNRVGYFEDAESRTAFKGSDGRLEFGEPEPHYFPALPWVEYVENDEKMGVYEGVLSLIEAYNKALSEKGNDVDYYADSYLVIAGPELDDEQTKTIRENRTINLYGQAAESAKAYFLEKPDSDGIQEHFIDRLESLIFKTSMVVDIDKDSFGTASGIALQWRLKPMSDLANEKELHFSAAVMERLKLLAGYPNTPLLADDWLGCEVSMERNLPVDVQAEAATAASLSGIVSHETQLSYLSAVKDPAAEIERMARERDSAEEYQTDYPTNRAAAEEEREDENDG